MSETKVILCPGQGAQSVGMGRAWHDASPAAAGVFKEADKILGNALGAPLSELCFGGPEEILNRTDAAQPALFTCGVACYRAVFGEHKVDASWLFAGLSLGEYTALVLAGAMGFEDGLKIVALRGRAMQEAAEARRSGMVALVGATEEQAQQLCEKLAPPASGRVLVPANFNAPGQIVISGELELCDQAVTLAAEMGLRAQKLTVAGAFHSPIMAPAADRLGSALENVTIKKPASRVLSNVTALPHGEGEFAGSSFDKAVRTALVRQLTRPVRWSQSCEWKVRTLGPAATYHELAPGRVLAGLFKRVDRSIKVTSHEQPGS